MSQTFVRQELANLSETELKSRTVLTVAVMGTLLTAICCFTPALVVLVGAIGLTTWLAWLDYVLVPVLVLFVGLTIAALVVRSNGKHNGGH